MDGRPQRQSLAQRALSGRTLLEQLPGTCPPEEHRLRLRLPPVTSTPSTDQEERLVTEIEERLRAYMLERHGHGAVALTATTPLTVVTAATLALSSASLASLFGAGFNHFWHAERRRPRR